MDALLEAFVAVLKIFEDHAQWKFARRVWALLCLSKSVRN
jgi:hypothetical protein